MKHLFYILAICLGIYWSCIKTEIDLTPKPPPCTSDSTGCVISLKDFDTGEPIDEARIVFDSLEYLCIYWCYHIFLDTITNDSGILNLNLPNTTKYTQTRATIYLDTAIYVPAYHITLERGCNTTFDIKRKKVNITTDSNDIFKVTVEISD